MSRDSKKKAQYHVEQMSNQLSTELTKLRHHVNHVHADSAIGHYMGQCREFGKEGYHWRALCNALRACEQCITYDIPANLHAALELAKSAQHNILTKSYKPADTEEAKSLEDSMRLFIELDGNLAKLPGAASDHLRREISAIANSLAGYGSSRPGKG